MNVDSDSPHVDPEPVPTMSSGVHVMENDTTEFDLKHPDGLMSDHDGDTTEDDTPLEEIAARIKTAALVKKAAEKIGKTTPQAAIKAAEELAEEVKNPDARDDEEDDAAARASDERQNHDSAPGPMETDAQRDPRVSDCRDTGDENPPGERDVPADSSTAAVAASDDARIPSEFDDNARIPREFDDNPRSQAAAGAVAATSTTHASLLVHTATETAPRASAAAPAAAKQGGDDDDDDIGPDI